MKEDRVNSQWMKKVIRHRKTSKTISIPADRNLQAHHTWDLLNKVLLVDVIGIEFNILKISILNLTFLVHKKMTLTLTILSTIRPLERSTRLEASISSIESIV